MKIKVSPKSDEITWEELADLLHESFEERLQQGLHFSCSYLTASDLERKSQKSIVLTAIDEDNKVLAGTVTLTISKENDYCLKAYHSNLAVKPDYKNQGVATLLFNSFLDIATANNCDYVYSDTAIGATSSVKWHKKNGYKIVGLRSFLLTNYYSYIFRLQLKHHPLWSNSLYCYLRFLLSALKCRLCYDVNGNYKMLMRLRIKFGKMLLSR